MPFADVSLLHGTFPALLGSLALCALGYAVIRWDRRWWWTRLLPITLASYLLVVAVNAALDLQDRFDEAIPASFLVWATMPLVAVGVTVAGWRHRRPSRRVTSILAIPLTAAFAANLINQHYGYEPTLAALFDTELRHQLDSNHLDLAAPASTTRPEPGKDVAGSSAALTTTTTTASPSGLDRAKMAAAGHGFVSTLVIPGTTSGFVAMDAYVWVPPAFFANPRPHLPVVMMLAGVPGQPANMIRAGDATVVADRYATTHAVWHRSSSSRTPTAPSSPTPSVSTASAATPRPISPATSRPL